MKARHIKNLSKTRIRAAGTAADLGTLIADLVPEVRLVRDDSEAEFVLMAVGELDAMIEDAAARAAYDRTRGEETVPIAIVDRLLGGEAPLKVWREHRSLSLTALADKAGVGKGYLSQLESGTRKGTLETMKKLAAVLNVDLDDLT